MYQSLADPFVGMLSMLLVVSGQLKAGAELVNTETGATEKLGKLMLLCGKKQTEVDTLCAGDIGMTAKLSNTNTNDTLAAESAMPKYTPISFPQSFMQMAVRPKTKGD